MAQASAQFYNHPSQQLKVVGVTGTNGKTTTAFMVKAIMEAAGISCGLLGTVQYQIGQRVIPASRTTPQSVDIQDMMKYVTGRLRRGIDGDVPREMDQLRVEGVDFDVAIFTNLSQAILITTGRWKTILSQKRGVSARWAPSERQAVRW